MGFSCSWFTVDSRQSQHFIFSLFMFAYLSKSHIKPNSIDSMFDIVQTAEEEDVLKKTRSHNLPETFVPFFWSSFLWCLFSSRYIFDCFHCSPAPFLRATSLRCLARTLGMVFCHRSSQNNELQSFCVFTVIKSVFIGKMMTFPFFSLSPNLLKTRVGVVKKKAEIYKGSTHNNCNIAENSHSNSNFYESHRKIDRRKRLSIFERRVESHIVYYMASIV